MCMTNFTFDVKMLFFLVSWFHSDGTWNENALKMHLRMYAAILEWYCSTGKEHITVCNRLHVKGGGGDTALSWNDRNHIAIGSQSKHWRYGLMGCNPSNKKMFLFADVKSASSGIALLANSYKGCVNRWHKSSPKWEKSISIALWWQVAVKAMSSSSF